LTLVVPVRQLPRPLLLLLLLLLQTMSVLPAGSAQRSPARMSA